MRMSIATRVSAACTAVLILSVLLFGTGMNAVEQVQAANEQVDFLSHMLQAQDREDRAQRKLRLALGDATRIAEQRGTVPDARWAELSAELRAFAALSASSPVPDTADIPSELRATVAETRAAALDFVPVGQALVETARRDPVAVKAAMPGFLGALKRLEAERTEAREALGHAIEAAVDANIAQGRRNAVRLLGAGLTALLILLASAVWLRLRIIAPIVAIAERLRDFDAEPENGAGVPGLERADELGDLARGLSEYREAVEQRRVAQRRVDFLAHHDVLTSLPNRLLFESRLSHELVRSCRTGDKVAVFAIDMDGFKAINDRYGHAGGDDALRRAAALLSDCIRADDLVARIGGDEFAIVQVAASQPAAAEALLSRLSHATAKTADAEVAIRMSIGVAISAPGQTGDELYHSADMALYRAKSDGRNTARFFDTGLQEEIRFRRRLARDLEGAIDAGELYLVFQPIATATMQVVGYEALLRWRHPELGEIAPGVFIPIAESTGQIGRIGMWTAERALAIAAGWDPALALSLNLSPIQFREPDLGRALLDLAERHGVAAGRLELEVTESATLLGHYRDAVLTTLKLLQAAGAKIAMDDFGTGHSSLSNLKDFGFDKLKIDRSFVAAMLTHQPSASIVKATIGLGRSLSLPIVAEGVETQPQLDLLREWGCDQVQGYLIGRPVEHLASGAAHPRAASPNKAA